MSRHYERGLSLNLPPATLNVRHNQSQKNRKMRFLCEDLKPAIARVSI